MTEATLDSLVLKLTADSAELKAEMRKVSDAVTKSTGVMTKQFDAVGVSMSKLGAIATAVLGIFSAGAFTKLIAESYAAIDVTAKMADRLGLGAEEYSALALSADLAGTSIEAVARGSTFLQRQLAAAADGSETAKMAFAQLKIPLDELSKMDTSAQMGAVADALNKLEDPSKRTALAMQVLGRGAMEMDAFLRDGSEGIRAAADEVAKYGGAISRVDQGKIEAANDQWTVLRANVGRVVDEIAVSLAPAVLGVFTKATELVQQFIKEMGGVQEIGRTVASTLAAGAGYIADAWVGVGAAFEGVKAIGAMVFGAFVQGANDVVIAFQYIMGFIGNLSDAVMKTGTAIETGFAAVWNGMKIPVAMFVQAAAENLSKLVRAAADAAYVFDAELGATIQATADGIAASTGTMAVDAKKNFNDMAAAAEQAGVEAAAATANIFDIEAPGSEVLAGMAEDFYAIGTESGLKFVDGALASMDGDASAKLDAWIAEFQAKAQAAGELAAATPKSTGDEEGQGAGANLALQKQIQEKLEILRKGFMDEQELELAAFQEKMAVINEAKDAQLITDSERFQLLEQLQFEHETNMGKIKEESDAKIRKMKEASDKAQLQGMSQFFSNMSSLMNTKSRALFEIGKAAAMATTVVNTASAAMSCFRVGSEMGGPYVGAAFAAAAIAAGAVQLSTISSASFGGGGSVGAGGMGVPAISGANPNSPNVGVSQPSGPTNGVNIVINGSSMSKEQAIELFEELEKLKGDGVTGRTTVS